MSDQKHTIVLVLKDGRGFSFRDVKLIVKHIIGKWKSENKPRIICLWDKASNYYNLGNFELTPLRNGWKGTWSRMTLYSPEMEQFRPFLYVDLDTAIIRSLENIFALVNDPSMFITLEDFYQKGQLATGLVWVPAGSDKIRRIWKEWVKVGVKGSRMDFFLRKVVTADIFWQDLTSTIYDFKPSKKELLSKVPDGANLVCFHGKPRIYDAIEKVGWVKDYVETDFETIPKKKVTVIIPYKKNRGWLQDAINSVPSDVQLIISQGKGNWPQNFNKVLNQAEGKYIKYLHEDDMLTENCIPDSVQAIEDQGADFIHGDAIEIYQETGKEVIKRPAIKHPTVQDLLNKNAIHSTTVMYRREIFEKLGGFDETLTICEEYEFNLRCLYNGMKIGYCPSTLAYYRRHPAQNIRVTSQSHHLKEKNMVKSKYV